ncbi:hypothetical protein KFL_002170160 [Klebsormidium nitens]|uniref:Uncharacterized protein n=1 Tax=Klebsormidium nitens TaxID=105231 RepID=A0A1Y1I4Y6_KLENI|nr:hypothetical protein KFL_002170160 [Klebsormidium nitens]|eukprot:GAQ85022.1 hypothetical protein KFL_002170160 [Klebsormidium nitens]
MHAMHSNAGPPLKPAVFLLPTKRPLEGRRQKLLQLRASASPTEGEPLTKTGFIADKNNQSNAYGLLAVIVAASAVGALAFPEQTLAVLLNARATPVSLSAVRAAGASLIPVAASHQCLKDAASHNRLSSATYKRLNLAVIFFWAIVLWIVVAAKLQSILPPTSFGILTAISIFGTALPWLISSSSGSSLVALYKDFSSSYGTVLKPTGATSAAYGFFSAACYALGAGLFYFPHHFQLRYPALLGASTAVPDFFWQMLANVYYASSVLFFVLKDASERGRLAASTFKNLNASFAAASLTILLNFVTEFLKLNHSIGDVGLGWSFQVLVLGLVFVVTSYNYLTARK